MASARQEPDDTSDRRRGTRELNWQFCELRFDDDRLIASLLNISSNGLLVLTPQGITTGNELEVHLMDLKGNPLLVRTRVARQIHGDLSHGKPAPIALGLEILNKPPEFDLLAASLAYNRIQKTSQRSRIPEGGCLRTSPRKAFIAACSIEIDDQFHEGVLRDVSETGLFVHTRAGIQPEAKVKLHVTDRSGNLYLMDGRAVRRGEYRHGIRLIPSSGVGFAIENTPTAFLEMLSTL